MITFLVIFVLVFILVLYLDRQLLVNDMKADIAVSMKQAEDLLAATPAATGVEVAKLFSVLKKHA